MESMRRHGILGSLTVGLGLFMAVIGFSPELAWGRPPGSQVRIPPGSWSGSLLDRLQALGYEVASLARAGHEASVVFDDGSTLVVDRDTGEFTLFDADDQEVFYGDAQATFYGQDTVVVSSTLTFVVDPETEHTLEATVEADQELDGVLVVTRVE